MGKKLPAPPGGSVKNARQAERACDTSGKDDGLEGVPDDDQKYGDAGQEGAGSWNHGVHCTRLAEEVERAQDSRRALTEISALKSLETGQPVSAALTAASNLDLSAPGTCATRSRWLLVMPKPSGSLSRVIVAVVSSLLAVMPAFPSCAESAMVKHPAWAAARSSSGLVPTPFSNLVLKEYCVCLRTPLSVEIIPFPSFKPPCQTADALRCMISLLVDVSLFLNPENSIPELGGRVYSENDLVEKPL